MLTRTSSLKCSSRTIATPYPAASLTAPSLSKRTKRMCASCLEHAVIAQHPRGFGRGESFLDPRHYLELLAHKHRAAERALVLSDGRIPASLHELFARYKAIEEATATKRWTKVLGYLADYPAAVVGQTVTHALARGTDDPEAIALLLRQRTAPPPPALLDPARLPEGARSATSVADLTRYALANVAEVAS